MYIISLIFQNHFHPDCGAFNTLLIVVHIDGEISLKKECLGYDTKLPLRVSLQLRDLKNVEYSFVAISSRSTLTRGGNTC